MLCVAHSLCYWRTWLEHEHDRGSAACVEHCEKGQLPPVFIFHSVYWCNVHITQAQVRSHPLCSWNIHHFLQFQRWSERYLGGTSIKFSAFKLVGLLDPYIRCPAAEQSSLNIILKPKDMHAMCCKDWHPCSSYKATIKLLLQEFSYILEEWSLFEMVFHTSPH